MTSIPRAGGGPAAAQRRLLGLLRGARSALLRPLLTFEPLPGAGVSRAAEGSWQADGRPPAFELMPDRGRFPSGPALLIFKLDSTAPFINPPVLYFDTGSGYVEGNSLLLPRPRDGVIQVLVKFPPGIRSMRFNPSDRPGSFALGALSVREIGGLEASARSLAPLVREIVSEPGRTRLALQKTWATLREGGLSGLRRRVRDRTRRNDGYEGWIAQFDALSPSDEAAIRAHAAALRSQPLFSVILPVYETPEKWLRWAIDSVRGQLYPRWELCIADDASKAPHLRPMLERYAALDPRIKVTFRPVNGHISESSNSALALATGDFAVLLDHDDELAPHALYLAAAALDASPDTDLLYSDEDKIDETGRRYDPYFKPDWNPDLMFSQNYFSHLGIYRLSLLREIGGFRKGYEGSQDYDLALRCLNRTSRVAHLPFVLYHWRSIPGSTATGADAKEYAASAATRALQDHFAPIDPRIVAGPGRWPTTHRVRHPLPHPPPLASLLIPTRDGLEVLRRCIDSVFAKTAYPRFEIIVVDNQSRDRAALEYLAELQRTQRARVLPYPHPFNYSAINNFAAQEALGEVLVLLNNDVEIIDPGWLEELVSQALRPEIAAVGAQLLYPDGTLQHAGVVTGLYGVAAHVHRHLPGDSPGYFARAQVVQQMTVVTGACLAVRKSVYQRLGGLDGEHLAVAFNDVDFCLRCVEAGYRNLYTPYARLYHHESYSRGAENTAEKRARFSGEVDYMKKRWAQVLEQDPCYNPNLSLHSEHFALAWPPRAHKPWK